jgi:hypothetical protein
MLTDTPGGPHAESEPRVTHAPSLAVREHGQALVLGVVHGFRVARQEGDEP